MMVYWGFEWLGYANLAHQSNYEEIIMLKLYSSFDYFYIHCL